MFVLGVMLLVDDLFVLICLMIVFLLCYVDCWEVVMLVVLMVGVLLVEGVGVLILFLIFGGL